MNEFKPYLEGLSQAATRTRLSLYMLVVASTLIGSNVWNYRPGSWDNRHIEVVNYAANHLGEARPDNTEEQALHDKAIEYVAVRDLQWNGENERTRQFLRELEKDLRDRMASKYGQIRAPIIGVAFNPNDTGLIGGFVLAVFLMVLRFSMARENETIQLAFEEAKRRNILSACYELLRMSQVLTVPPKYGAESQSQPRWNLLHKTLFLLPLLVQFFVVLVDIRTFQYGWVVSHSSTIIELLGGVGFFIVILVLTVSCYRVSWSTDEYWRQYAIGE